MKIKYLTVAIILFTGASYGQGLLGKLKDKVSQTADLGGGGKAGEFYIPSEKQAKKDLETKTLEAMDFSADKTGISGVYISQNNIGLAGERGLYHQPIKSIKKFAFQLSASGKSITITSNLAGEGVKPLLISPIFGGEIDEKLMAEMIKKKIYFQYSKKDAISENRVNDLYYIEKGFVFDKDTPSAFTFDQYFTVLEPGVIVLHPYARMEDSKKCEGPMYNNNSNNEFKHLPFNLFYKEGQDISKWTKEAIQSKLFEYAKIFCQSTKGTQSANTQMPAKVSGFKEEPSNANLLKAAQNRAKNYKWRETVVSVYPTTKWFNIVKNLGVNQVPTLVGRYHQINVVLKDETGCSISMMEITQDNAYTVGSMVENYAGKEVYASGNGSPYDIDCVKTKVK
jgi:hypothetical protein